MTNAAPPEVVLRVDSIVCAILRPKIGEDAIGYIPVKGELFAHVFGSAAECDKTWAELEQKLGTQGFVRYYDSYFRPEMLMLLEQGQSEESGYYIRLFFSNSFEFKQPYSSEKSCKNDHARLVEMLSILQDVRASRRASATKH